MTVVEARNLSKNYPLSPSSLARLRHLFASGKHPPQDGLWALRDVSFSVERGEAFGIIGANGSGKSTLLRIIAGILQPTSGSVQVNGRLSALLELGSGFSPEFTGRDNVYLNASLHGLSRREIDDRLPEIERFAGIGAFIGQPIRIYSTGMVLRLAFAVAAHIDPEILVVDEALAVGDIAFRQRCMRKIHELRAHGTTILFVSHETSDVKALCERCLWLRDGVVQECGEADAVIGKYLSAVIQKEILHREIPREEVRPTETQRMPDNAVGASGTLPDAANGLVSGFDGAVDSHRFGDGRAAIVGADLVTPSRQSVRTVTPLDRLVLRIGFQVRGQVASPIAGFIVRNNRGENIFGSNTARENYPLPPMAAGDANNVEFHWSVPALAPGAYKISLGVADGDIEDHHMCDYIEDAIGMTVAATDGSNASRGYFQLRCAAVAIHADQRR